MCLINLVAQHFVWLFIKSHLLENVPGQIKGVCRIKLLGLLIEIQVGYTTKEDYDFNIDHDTFNKYN